MIAKNNSKRKSPARRNFSDLKCIWMGTSAVDYKLCDNNFQCDDCSFDKVVRNMSPDEFDEGENIMNSQDILSKTIEELKNEKYGDNKIYLKNNLRLKKLFDNKYYIGLSPLIAHFLDDVGKIKCDVPGDYVYPGDELLKINGSWGEVSVFSPLRFRIVEKVGDRSSENENIEWVSMVEVDEQDIIWARATEKEFNTNRDRLIEFLNSQVVNVPEVGTTMYDGAPRASHLHQFCGKEAYLETLKKNLAVY